MGTTREEIRSWLERGRREIPDVTHMIVACDTFDHEDYPVYVRRGEDVGAERQRLDDASQMSRVMEIYAYALDLEAQLAEPRAFHQDAWAPATSRLSEPESSDPTSPGSSARWVGPDETCYAIVPVERIGDRPRWFLSRASVESHLRHDGDDRSDLSPDLRSDPPRTCGPRTPEDLHLRPFPLPISRGADRIVGLVIPDEIPDERGEP